MADNVQIKVDVGDTRGGFKIGNFLNSINQVVEYYNEAGINRHDISEALIMYANQINRMEIRDV